MVIEVLFIVTMALCFFSNMPQAEPYGWTRSWLLFAAVLELGIYIFMPGLR